MYYKKDIIKKINSGSCGLLQEAFEMEKRNWPKGAESAEEYNEEADKIACDVWEECCDRASGCHPDELGSEEC